MIEWREFDCPWIETNEGWDQLSRFDPRLQDEAAAALRAIALAAVLFFLPGAAHADPTADLLATPSIQKAVGAMHGRAIGMHQTLEFATAVQDDGTFRIIMGSEGVLASAVKTNAHTVLIIHTHPDGSMATPSAHDIAEAKASGIPDVVVSRYSEYLVSVDGTVQKL